MDDKNCPYHEVHEGRIRKVEKRCDQLENKVIEIDKNTAVKTTEIMGILDTLATLPKTMTDISNTMLLMQNEIEKSNEKTSGLEKNFEKKFANLETKIDKVDKKVEKVDEEGHFNIRIWIKNNWIGIVIGLGSLIYAYIK